MTIFKFNFSKNKKKYLSNIFGTYVKLSTHVSVHRGIDYISPPPQGRTQLQLIIWHCTGSSVQPGTPTNSIRFGPPFTVNRMENMQRHSRSLVLLQSCSSKINRNGDKVTDCLPMSWDCAEQNRVTAAWKTDLNVVQSSCYSSFELLTLHLILRNEASGGMSGYDWICFNMGKCKWLDINWSSLNYLLGG